MKFFAAAASLALVSFSYAALPNDVVVKSLPDGCASYPLYDANTGVAGPWTLKTWRNEDPNIRGFGNTHVYSVKFDPRVDRKPTIRWGYITIPTRNDIAKTPLRCFNNALEARVATDLTEAGEPTNFQWTPLSISSLPWDAPLLYKYTGGLPVKVFEHYIDGVKQDGVFLGGYDNTTLWGFKYSAEQQGSYGMPYYYMRLLGPDSADPTTGAALKANETRGFIMIDA
ncbi:hypothetical protein CC78DRAFT_535020 [Lojkania enalia]|uniref:Uncharacterized protein n=1 Tax=Lojkania enalia TaxID=147567 RepID=A0A9P4K5X4_9PLEO|nr:hypothetical protein CC78DRAFT_535020 [Didymosphaeria enalia]